MAFKDLSEKQDQSYFSDGISEELSNRLAQVAGLQVAGRSSSMSFKGKDATIAQIGKALGVDSVLEGSVRKDGDRLRVNVQLSKVSDGYQLWSQTYDRDLTDIFAVQEDIAISVVDSLKLKLLVDTTAQAGGGHTPGFDVYDVYLKGREAMMRSKFPEALAYFQRATELDPQFARGWSSLAMAQSFTSESDDDPKVIKAGADRAMESSEKAIALDPNLGDGYAARGYLRARDQWDWTGALSDLERAVQLDPHDGRNLLRHGFLLLSMGRMPEASAALEQATSHDPMLVPAWAALARTRTAQFDFEGARDAWSRVVALQPESREAVYSRGLLLLLEGKRAEAHAIFAESKNRYAMLLADESRGTSAEAKAFTRELLAREHTTGAYYIGVAYLWMGDKDKAFEWLERAVAQREASAAGIAYDPLLRELRSDPRFPGLLAKLKLPPP